MTTVQVEAQVSTDELLNAVGKLGARELEEFTSRVIALHAKKKAPALSSTEAGLLIRINQPLPVGVRERYEVLVERRRNETLSLKDHEELLQLTDQVEGLEAERVERLLELADLRKTSLHELMDSLGIRAPEYA